MNKFAIILAKILKGSAMKIGIIGLGLIGGSLGLALKKMKLIDKVCGFDASSQNAKDALELGLVDEICSIEEMKTGFDAIFLAVPVEAIAELMNKLQGCDKNTTIIDLGSTKRTIIKSCPQSLKAQFVGAHPMAGTEFSGPFAAKDGLLNGAIVVLCDDVQVEKEHIKKATELLSHAGMRIIFMDSVSHDHHVGFISHLPHAISFSLVNATLSEEERRNIFLLGGTSFAGMARIAKSSEIMWTDIFKQNKDNILNAMAAFKAEFAKCEQMLENERWEELREWMKNARKIKDIL